MYPSTDSPRYVAGGSATAGAAFLVAIMAVIIRFILIRYNRILAEREIEAGEAGGQSTVSDTHDNRTTGFRYIL
jgi:hypothetical protein